MLKGIILTFFDADDIWDDKLELQIYWMQKNGYAFTYSSYEEMMNFL